MFANNEFISVMNNPKNRLGHGLVTYHSFDDDINLDIIRNYQNKRDAEVLFKKDISYSGQREFRLIKNISKDIKGEECSFPELDGHIFESSIKDLENHRIALGFH